MAPPRLHTVPVEPTLLRCAPRLTLRSAHNGRQPEHRQAQIAVALDANLLQRSLAPDALGKDPPCDLGRYGHVRVPVPLRRLEHPASRVPAYLPLPAALAGNRYPDRASLPCLQLPIPVRQTAQEAVQNRVIQFRSHDAGPPRSQANLLLMVPAFGQLA